MYCDTRLYGQKKWYSTHPKDADMKVPSDILKVVAYLCVKGSEGYQSFGTGFFVAYTYEDSEWHFNYFVTAKHLIDDAKAEGYEDFWVRINKKEGGIEYLPLERTGWSYFNEEPIDLAAHHVVLDPNLFDYQSLAASSIVTTEIIEKYNVGLGDELILVGLFTKRKGRTKNIPILRVGTLAAMADEPLLDEFGYEYLSYLAEVRSIGGLSGSPVCVYLNCYTSDAPNLPKGQQWKIFLLGLIRGHWRLDEDVKDSSFTLDAPKVLADSERLNTGIALVTPANYLLPILEHPNLDQNRREWIRMKEKEDQPVLDTGLKSDNIFDDTDFQDALKKVSRKVSEPESGKKETSE